MTATLACNCGTRWSEDNVYGLALHMIIQHGAFDSVIACFTEFAQWQKKHRKSKRKEERLKQVDQERPWREERSIERRKCGCVLDHESETISPCVEHVEDIIGSLIREAREGGKLRFGEIAKNKDNKQTK